MNPQTLLITGASSGLGAAIARHAAACGHHLHLVARRRDALAQTAATCDRAASITLHPLDLADADAVAQWLPTLPPPDILINNAGSGLFKPALETTDDETAAMLRLNTLAPIQLIHALAPAMVARGHGHIINIISQAGKIATPKTAAYAASKHALLGYSNALRLELAGSGVFVTSVNPGPMLTAFFDHADPDGAYQQALGRFWLTDADALAATICAAFNRRVRDINRPRLMETAARLYPLAPRLGDWLTRRFFSKK